MRADELQKRLVNWTVANSGHDERRHYIGLSGIGDCPRQIYDRYFQGQRASVDRHLLTRLSYEIESDLVGRLHQMGICSAILPSESQVALAYDGLVQGHVDAMTRDGDLVEIKTVALEDHIPERLPRRVYWQVQAYMHYLKCKRQDCRWTHVVYLARQSGLVKVIPVRYSPEMGARVEAKVKRLVVAVRDVARPECECGKCSANESANKSANKVGGGDGDGVDLR